ncbi:MAG: penicillin-binding protein activator [Alphaproteobacteria bacterium]|nr:penicillin-binding protein activator [Alphaproteobacteria bacterium]
MHIKNFLGFMGGIVLLTGCGTQVARNTWHSEYGTYTTGTPATMYGTPAATDATPHRMAVLLPLSGDNAATGRAIKTSIETAVLQRAPSSLSVSFFDTSAGATAINDALGQNPEIIVGPLFAADARMLRAAKPAELPAISFTSDATAIGDGVMTMALMPSNGVEAIVSEIAADNSRGMVILAPDTNSGRLMAAAARAAATNYDLPVSGLIYYREKDTDSIKNTAQRASLYSARSAANTRAREILSDILTTERLTAIEKSSLSRQLDRISKSETIGRLPYDAVLLLGTGDDAKSLVSFLRYYGVTPREAHLYGTAIWDGADINSDITLTGAKYPALPEMNPSFANLYEQISGTLPSRMASFGYDAANLAIGTVYSDKSNAAYLLDPSGYVGIDGLVRLTPNGASQRALRIVEIAGETQPRPVKDAPTNFFKPIYNVDQITLSPAREMALETPGINPLTYIQIPDRLTGKYKSKTYGANVTQPDTRAQQNIVTILPEDDSTEIISNPDFKPRALESVNRTYIDSVEIYE